MARQTPPSLTMLVSAMIFVSSAAAAAYPASPSTAAASNKYALVPATNSLLFGNGYSVTWGPAGITSAVDSHGAPLKFVNNPDGSVTVDKVYTAYPNGTLTGPGIVIVTSGPTAGFSMGKTRFLENGTIVDASGKKVTPTLNTDGSYTAGDLKGWSNGTIVGPTGASIYLGAPLALTPDGSIGFVAPSSSYSYKSTTNSLTFGKNCTVTWSETGFTSAVDSTGATLKGFKNLTDGSVTVDGAYTAYTNGTLIGPGIIVVVNGPTAGFSMGKTTLLKNGTIVGASGKPVAPTANADGSYTAGELRGWSNGTIVGPTGASIYLGAPLTLNPNGIITFASNSGASGSAPSASPSPSAAPSSAAPSPSAAPSSAAPPSAAPSSAAPAPPPSPSPSASLATPSPTKAAGLLATPVTALTAVITLMLGTILFV
ncbi:unnamed protein product [Closterium sp. NIES-65]|nr:unnamed protein product [Closterium sp. NIES-65]